MDFQILVPFFLALSSSPHCLMMCGGIVGAASFHRHDTHGKKRGEWSFLIAVNVGKMTSYTLAGAMVAAFGHSIFDQLSLKNGHLWLLGAAGLILIGNGMFLLGRFPAMRQIEGIGNHLWQLLEPLARRLILSSNLKHGFFLGMVWGWFPCTLVYGTLLWSSASCTIASGSLAMAIFGLGTFPAMMGAGWLTGLLHRCGGIFRFGHIMAWILTGFGIFCLSVAVLSVYYQHVIGVDLSFVGHAQNAKLDGSHGFILQTFCPIPP
ncbi:MAG: sulfite exporter TauE/SafE family protein [Magnetococcales bacterium]|nr:sulfite exporter TauE/SafE family protein [Magnetococcales bacterium]